MSTLITVSGTLRDRQSNVLANTDVSIVYRKGVRGNGDVLVPIEVITVQTDAAGVLSVDLAPGEYLGRVMTDRGPATFTIGVPPSGSPVNLADIIDQEVEIDQPMVTAAREARDAAATHAQAAETAASEAAASAAGVDVHASNAASSASAAASSASAAAASETNAAASASAAATSETNAATSETNAERAAAQAVIDGTPLEVVEFHEADLE